MRPNDSGIIPFVLKSKDYFQNHYPFSVSTENFHHIYPKWANGMWFWWRLLFPTKMLHTSYKRRKKICFSLDIFRFVDSNLFSSFVYYICPLFQLSKSNLHIEQNKLHDIEKMNRTCQFHFIVDSVFYEFWLKKKLTVRRVGNF